MSLRPGGPREQWSQVIKEVPAHPALQRGARAWGPRHNRPGLPGHTPEEVPSSGGRGWPATFIGADSPGPWRGPGAGVRVPRHPPCPPARVSRLEGAHHGSPGGRGPGASWRFACCVRLGRPIGPSPTRHASGECLWGRISPDP